MNTKTLPALGLLALAGAALAFQDGALLRRTFVADSSDAYSVESVIEQVVSLEAMGMGDQPMTLRSTSTLTVATGKVDPEKGSAEVEIVTSDMKMVAEGLAAMMGDPSAGLPKEVRVPGTMDGRNRFAPGKSQAPGMSAMMMGGMATSVAMQFIEFPEGRVKPGDTWDVVQPKNPSAGGKDTTLTAGLEGERERDGTSVWVVTLSGTIPVEMDLGELAKQNPEMTGGMAVGSMKITGTMVVKATALIEKGTGRTLELDMKVETKQSTELSDMGVTVDSSGTTTTKMVLKK